MNETIISVQGHHTALLPAERATVTVNVVFDGPERDPAFASATAALDAVRALVEPLYDAANGPVTWWSAETVRVWSKRPWNNDGAQLDLVHHAALDLIARFTDFEAMAVWIEGVVAVAGTGIQGIEWSLTEATQTSATADARSRAVTDAVAKAGAYAQSIGLATVTATAIADPGMLGDGATGSPAARDAHWMSAKAGGEPSLALRPQQIEVSAAVDARFVAR